MASDFSPGCNPDAHCRLEPASADDFVWADCAASVIAIYLCITGFIAWLKKRWV